MLVDRKYSSYMKKLCRFGNNKKKLILQENRAFRKGRFYEIRRYLWAYVTRISPTDLAGDRTVQTNLKNLLLFQNINHKFCEKNLLISIMDINNRLSTPTLTHH